MRSPKSPSLAARDEATHLTPYRDPKLPDDQDEGAYISTATSDKINFRLFRPATCIALNPIGPRSRLSHSFPIILN